LARRRAAADSSEVAGPHRPGPVRLPVRATRGLFRTSSAAGSRRGPHHLRSAHWSCRPGLCTGRRGQRWQWSWRCGRPAGPRPATSGALVPTPQRAHTRKALDW